MLFARLALALLASLLAATPALAEKTPFAAASEAPAAPAAAMPDPADWEALLQAAPLPESALPAWAKQPDLRPEPEGPTVHYVVRRHPHYPGGIDVYLDAQRRAETAVLYLAVGPLFLPAQIARAAQLQTPLTLSWVRARYGEPAERYDSTKTGATFWTYHFAGDPKRTLQFGTLPHSACIHRISIIRE